MNPLDLIFPKRCVGCEKIGVYICLSCQKSIVAIAPNECICPVCEKPAIGGATHPRCMNKYTIDGLSSFFYYNDVVRKAIKTIKYRFVSDMASAFMDIVPISAYEIRSVIGDPHVALIPIPLHTLRLRYRGFNQAELLGMCLANILQIPMRSDVIDRIKETHPQVNMSDRGHRLSNMEGVFAMNKKYTTTPAIKKERNILLFDDVFTTGATMRAAASLLKRNGYKFVWGVTIAR